jgi:hypothetical protein
MFSYFIVAFVSLSCRLPYLIRWWSLLLWPLPSLSSLSSYSSQSTTPPPSDLFDCCVYRHRICDRPLLLRLCLVATIIPLSNARRQVVVVDVVVIVVVDMVVIIVNVVVVVVVVVDVVVVRRHAVTVVAIVVIVVSSKIDALRSTASDARSDTTKKKGHVNYDVSNVPVEAHAAPMTGSGCHV